LQIKDYLLAKKNCCSLRGKICFHPLFYTTSDNCSLCEEESLILANLRTEYPELRVYFFDYSTDLSAVASMLQIYKIKDTALPALVIDDNVLTGFRTIQDLEVRIKESFKLQGASTVHSEITQPVMPKS